MRNKYLLFAIFAILLLNTQDAHAYINPGTGSYFFQTIISGVLSILFLFKKLFLKILSVFRNPIDDKKD